MVVDIHELPSEHALAADVCIVGSGAAGISLAREFLHTSASVVVLEAGAPHFDGPSQDPYHALVTGLPHGGIHQGRVRILGGATTLWAGQALPYFDCDFAAREWMPYSGWPITRQTLDPFYARALDVMQLPPSTSDLRSWPAFRKLPPAYAPDTIVPFYSQFTSVPSFAQKYRAELASAANIRLITRASVTSLEAAPNAASLDHLRVRSIRGHQLSVRARYTVLCCGGIETARLLLLSDSVEHTGIGNRHDVVGRFFQDHPGVGVPVQPVDSARFGALYNPSFHKGIKYAIKMATSPGLQRSARIGHMGGEIYYAAGEDDPIADAKHLVRLLRRPREARGLPSALGKVLRRPGTALGAAWRYLRHGVPPTVGTTPPLLGFGGEQQPNPASRVTLSAETDVFGCRRTVLDWKMTRDDSRSILVFLHTIAAEWKRLNLASIDLDRIEIMGREVGEHGAYVDANHHMGTTRMGTDLKTSVVDAQCRVHGYDNLYIASASVFPTGGFSNPTLTVIALTLRIADELKQLLRN